MKIITVKFFKNESDKEPVREWLLDLSPEDRKIIGADIKTVEFGWPIGMPVCRPLGQGLYEVRSSLSQHRIARIIFTVHKNEMVLLHAFIKKAQKIPESELKLARNRLKDVKDVK